ncbi:MAG: hypothetical protein Q8900_09030 [Bacillota bacterium]|nr:hypothetical protein [Bacillota bacterium]
MKKLLSKLLLFIFILSTIVFTSCSNVTNQNSNSNSNSNKNASITTENKNGNLNDTKTQSDGNDVNGKQLSNSVTTQKDNNNGVRDIKPLGEKDFVVTDGVDTITLDMLYKNFKTNKQEVKQDTDYVGDVTSGEYVYKYYMHAYNDFNIYISNVNYNLKNRSIDDRYITEITLKNSNFKTKRDISVSSNLEDIINAYGNGKKMIIDDNSFSESYQYKDMELTFIIDKQNKVNTIVLKINVS